MAAGKAEVVGFKQIANVLFDTNPNSNLNKSGKWPLVIDANPNPMTVTFLKYRDVNLVDAYNPEQMLSPETLRLAILGALRFGKPLVLDLGNNPDLFTTCMERLDEVSKGIGNAIMNKSIINEEEYGKLVRKTDAPEYQLNNVYLVDNFSFVLVTTNPQVDPKLLSQTYPIEVKM